MRPTFLSFDTAYRALAAAQAQIDVAGNNMSNADTDGYTRQRVDLNAVTNSGYNTKYASDVFSGGWGVKATGISQIRDPFLDARYRNEAADNGTYGTIVDGLKDLQRVLDEIDTGGIQTEISAFIQQLQTFSTAPTDTDMASVVRTAAQKVTQILNTYANQIEELRIQEKFDLENVVVNNDFNSTVKNIASLNKQIRDEQLHGNTPNDLYDQRNYLIDHLSTMANIKVVTSSEKISEDLSIENLSISIYDENSGKSISLIKNGLYNTLNVAEDPNDRRLSIIEIQCSFDAPADSDITRYLSNGSIKGYLDLINGQGSYANPASDENDFRGTLYYANLLDSFASGFANEFNELNKGADITGPDKPLFSATGGGTITADNIQVSDEWLDNPLYITTTRTSGASTPDNIERMITKPTTDKLTFTDAKGGTAFTGTMSEFLTMMTADYALDIQLYENFEKTSNAVLGQLFEARESVSGVVLDEEGINIMSYQKAYNAAARYFTVLDEALDTLINGMGLVGRG